jgi:hypothetical protein
MIQTLQPTTIKHDLNDMPQSAEIKAEYDRLHAILLKARIAPTVDKIKALEIVSAANLSLFTIEQEANISAIASELLQDIYV